MEARCESWNMKICEDKSQTIYFSHRRTPVGTHLTLKGRKTPFVKEVKYLGVIFYSRVTWRAVIAQSVQRWDTGWTTGVLGFDSRW
jgi:hypothetical protein